MPSVRLRRVVTLNPPKREVVGHSADRMVPFLPMEAVSDRGEVDLSHERPFADLYGGYTYFRSGDVLLAKITPCFENGKGAVVPELPGGFGFGTTEFHVLRPSARVDARFLYYVSQSMPFRHGGAASMTGAAGQQRVSADFVADYAIPLLPIERQRAIADFLDHKTAAIDTVIAQQRALLDRLAEERAAVINRAVTRGLDVSAPVKDSASGIMPRHWELRRLKFLMNHIIDCLHSTPDYLEDGGYPAIRTSDISAGHLDVEGARRVDLATFHHRNQRLAPQPGDIIYSREGERYGLAACVPPGAAVCLAQRVMLFRTSGIVDPTYVMWVLNSSGFSHQVIQDTVGATSPRINIATIREALVPLPPLGEQRAIIEHIDRHTASIDAARDALTTQIARLQEYRQSVITHAVTGRVAPEPS